MERVPYIDRFAILAARFKLGKRLDNTDGLLIKVFAQHTQNLHFSNFTILFHNELKEDLTFYILLSLWIFEVFLDVFYQGRLTTWELRHLLNSTINSVVISAILFNLASIGRNHYCTIQRCMIIFKYDIG